MCKLCVAEGTMTQEAYDRSIKEDPTLDDVAIQPVGSISFDDLPPALRKALGIEDEPKPGLEESVRRAVAESVRNFRETARSHPDDDVAAMAEYAMETFWRLQPRQLASGLAAAVIFIARGWTLDTPAPSSDTSTDPGE